MRAIALTVFLSSVFFCALAQSDQKPVPQEFNKSFAVKYNPVALAFGGIAFQGEYHFKRKKSFTLGINVPAQMTRRIEVNNQERDVTTKTFSTYAGYRMYFGKKPMRGFYFEPFLHYTQNEMASIIDGTLSGAPVDFAATGKYTAFGLGAQLGVQFLIANRVVIDLFILGPEANSTKYTLVLRDITSAGPWDAQDVADAQREINETIEDVPGLKNKVKVTLDANQKTATSDYKGFLPGVRGGLSVGIRF
jgi:hypothetical protein